MKPLSLLFRVPDGRSFGHAFLLLCALFLLSGVCNSMLDTLNKHFQNSFDISKMKSALVQNAFYLGYFLMALPAGLLARRFGYKAGLMIGLAVIMLGALWFIPATRIGTFGAFLTGLFILASGFACLETIMNPCATALGPPEASAARINLAQSCNGIGWMVGPALAGSFILSSTSEVNKSNDALHLPYLLLGLGAAAMLVIIGFSNIPDLHAEGALENANLSATPLPPLWKRWHFTLSIAAQFCYVAAQTGIFSYFINFLATETPPIGSGAAARLPDYMVGLKDGVYHFTDRGAATLLSVGAFGLFLLGRITGSVALRTCLPHRMLALYSAANVGMMLCIVLRLGWISVGALFLSFFLMSISYPTIFALGIHGLGEQTKRASSFLVMAILGGAFMPLFMGWLADYGGLRAGFLMPLVMFGIVTAYATAWPRLMKRSLMCLALLLAPLTMLHAAGPPRAAPPIREKNDGLITSSGGAKTAKETWGKAHDWCDYSGVVDGQRVGITLMSHPGNIRPSWFHNRNYGLMAANTFGRNSMRQGEVSRVEVKQGDKLRLRFGLLLHASAPDKDVDLTAAYRDFLGPLTVTTP